MSDKKLTLKVITPKGILIDTVCDAVYSTSETGEFGVLPGHIPMTTNLAVGYTKFITDKNETYMTTLGGIFQVENDEVTILSDTAELGSDIDVAQAKADKQKAEAILAEHTIDEANMTVTQIALAKSLARLKVAVKTGNMKNNNY